MFYLCPLGSFAGPISLSLSHQRHHYIYLPNNALNEIVGRLVVSYPDHRLSKLRNQDWNPPTHPCVLYFSGFLVTQFPATRVPWFSCSDRTLFKTSALYRICSSMAVSLSTAEDFFYWIRSPLFFYKKIASEILPRHRVIRQQIEVSSTVER